ncbi:hypothetical protein [Acutalibacter caecimuris]|uniref:hypothetical protein n=1 Tax=Acutalibacter caecimuris TaxID=3093657 RepID=UPI002AC95D85|nr:hypothetical protein [Acutalibacter sp. M00118]
MDETFMLCFFMCAWICFGFLLYFYVYYFIFYVGAGRGDVEKKKKVRKAENVGRGGPAKEGIKGRATQKFLRILKELFSKSSLSRRRRPSPGPEPEPGTSFMGTLKRDYSTFGGE